MLENVNRKATNTFQLVILSLHLLYVAKLLLVIGMSCQDGILLLKVSDLVLQVGHFLKTMKTKR